LFFQKLEGKGKMKDRIIAFSLILTLLVSAIVLMAPVKNVSVLSEPDPDTIIVPDDYPTIQEAINHAKEGDTIFVHNGTYYENLVINNEISLEGESKSHTIIDGNGSGTVVTVGNDSVTVANFTIRNSGNESGDSGLCLYSNDNRISTNIILNNNLGISLSHSYRNILINNIMLNNTYGIYSRDSFYNIFTRNAIQGNALCGVYFRDSYNNSIYHNRFNNTKQADVKRSNNTWDDGYPSGGNYWSDYTDGDADGDGIGDTPYNITATEIDHYPRFLTVRNVNTGLDYFWIQEAIDAEETRDGHTIKVNAFIYPENVIVYKSLTLLPRENRATAIIDGGGSGTVIKISASNVSISNFTVQNGYYGIHLDGSGNAILRNNNMTNNKYNFFVSGTKLSHFINDIDDSNWVNGKQICYLVNNQNIVVNSTAHPNLGYLALVNCKNITVQNLHLTGNGQGLLLAFTNSSIITHINASYNDYGIDLFTCSEDTIVGNDLMENDGEGIYLRDSFGNNVTDNNLAENLVCIDLFNSNSNSIAGNQITKSSEGISLFLSFGNNVTCNNVTNNHYGIRLDSDSFGNNITDNNIAGNWSTYQYGMYLSNSDNNSIASNNIIKNRYGIYVFTGSSGNRIISNIIRNNTDGIFLQSSSNRIYHNSFLENKKKPQGQVYGVCTNTWDDGLPSGGNFWSDYNGTDANGNGIGDTPYTIDSRNVDHYPLMKPYGGEHDIGIKTMDLSRSSTCYTMNYTVNITVTVTNYGVYSETGINITVQALPHKGAYTIPIGSKLFSLSSRNSWTHTFAWNTTGCQNGTYSIEANITTHILGEIYFGDNIKQANYSISVMGDINGDLKVDIKDLVLVIKHYASYPGHPVWNPDADVNNDGKVDIKDLVLVIKHFKESIPDP
jgi:parallel beta-helix repeat protein